MKKLLVIIATALCLASCSKENTTPTALQAEYSLKMLYSPKEEVLEKLSYDAQISDKFIFYEYNESNMQVACNVWDKPSTGGEKSFIASETSTKFTICYEIEGTRYDGTQVYMSMWFSDIFSISKGQKTSVILSATTPTRKNNPI